MDNPKECPFYLVDPSWEASFSDTKTIVDYIRKLPKNDPPLVQPIISPRFAISCTSDLLTALGKYADENPSLRIQTHYAENLGEVERTLELFHAKSYADVYNNFHLLRRNTILGHGVHVTDHELRLIREKGAGIAHCPSSNFFLRSGSAPIGHYLDMGVKVHSTLSSRAQRQRRYHRWV